MEIDIVSFATGRSVPRLVEPALVHFLWAEKDKDHPRIGLITVLLHCPDCGRGVELTLAKLHGRYRIACPHCPGVLDLREATARCLTWVGYWCLFETGLAIEPEGALVCLRSDRQPAKPASATYTRDQT